MISCEIIFDTVERRFAHGRLASFTGEIYMRVPHSPCLTLSDGLTVILKDSLLKSLMRVQTVFELIGTCLRTGPKMTIGTSSRRSNAGEIIAAQSHFWTPRPLCRYKYGSVVHSSSPVQNIDHVGSQGKT
jgi:hypothetical protein